jgi:hypothetical protein
MNKSNGTPPQTLEAGEFILRDAAGRVGARLSMSPIGSQLVLCGESGSPRVTLHVMGEQPGLVLDDANGSPRATLVVGDNGPHLALQDTKGELRALLMVRDDEPLISLMDRGGKTRVALCLGDDEALLYLFDSKGRPRALLGVMSNEGLLHLYDAKDKGRVALGGARTDYVFGNASLVCWAAVLLLAPFTVSVGGPMGVVVGVLALGGIASAALWARYRWLWWKTKGRAIASDMAASQTSRH